MNKSEMIYSKSDIIYSKSQSPFGKEDELTEYQRNRKELMKNVDEMEFETFSFSDDTDLSLDDIPIYEVTSRYKMTKELDEMMVYLSMRKAELLAEIEQLEKEMV